MVTVEALSLESIGRFVAGSEEIRFGGENREQVYGWVERVLVGRKYAQLGKAARGPVRRYIEKMIGLSRTQVTRLIGLYTASGPVQVTVYRRRRKSQPQDQPGFLRLDTVHQGDEPKGGEKAVYHVNAVDEVTQWEVAGATPRISDAYLQPVLEHMLRQCPLLIGMYCRAQLTH